MSCGPHTVLIFLFAALFASIIQGARIDSVSVTVDRKTTHETFVPMVAFKCGFRNKFLNQSGEWQDDQSSAAVCLEGKLDILKYCKRAYPDRKITNIVEYGHISHIESWCKETGHGCRKSFYVRPYRCIEGEFIADSLQVPSKCKFGHVSGRETCDDYDHWSKKAENQCGQSLDDHDHKAMKLHSFAMLEPCGLSLFRGVEYVCCPKSVEEIETKINNEYLETDEDEEDNEDLEDDDDEDELDDQKSKDESNDQDPYFTEDAQANEHERYREAQERLEKKYRGKVTKVITEWSELFERYNKMKLKDPEGAEKYKSEMTSRFRKTVASLEDENKEQRKQLEELHDERVQSALNEKKRKATHDYRMSLAIQVGHVNKQNVLRTLKDYIRAEEKDRAHMLNRYRHLLRSNPESASSFEPMLLHRLRYIDLRINGTLAMLRDFPDLERQIRPVAEEYWHSYRLENTPEIDGKLMEVDENAKDANEKLVQLYKNAADRKSKTTRVQSSFHEIAKQSRKNSDVKTPLKELLSDKKKPKEEIEPDSDEDQFEEDDEIEAEEEKDTDDEQIETSPIIVNETVTAERRAEKLAAQQRFAKEQHSHKLARERGAELPPLHSDKQSIKAFDLSKSKPLEDNSIKDDENEDDVLENEEENEDDSEEQEIEIDDRLFVRKEVAPAYARHDKLMADGVEPHEHITNSWNSQTTLLAYIAMVLCVIVIAGIVIRHRHSRQGFIEVDVCNPDDYHVNKMQVNGFENPIFYHSKP